MSVYQVIRFFAYTSLNISEGHIFSMVFHKTDKGNAKTYQN